MPNPSHKDVYLFLRDHWRVIIQPTDDRRCRAFVAFMQGRPHRLSPTAKGATEAEALRGLTQALRDIEAEIQERYCFEGQAEAGDVCPNCGFEAPTIVSAPRAGVISELRCRKCEQRIEKSAPPEPPLERYDPAKHKR